MHASFLWRGLVAAVVLFCANLAQAVTFNGGAAPSGCTYDNNNKIYTCSSLPTDGTEVITIGSSYRVNVTGAINPSWNQVIQMSGSAILSSSDTMNLSNINPANLQITGGTLITSSNFKVGSPNPLSANIQAAKVEIGGGNTTVINGNVVSTGDVTLQSKVRINGNLSGVKIETNSPVHINGNTNATNSFELASGSTVVGNITAPTVTFKPSSSTITGTITSTGTVTIGAKDVVNGNIYTGDLILDDGEGTAVNGNVVATGYVKLGSNTDVYGNVSADGSVTMDSGNTKISGTVTASSVQMGYGTTITQPVTCTSSNGGTCGCAQGSTSTVQCAPSAPAAPDHIQITHPGSGLTCQPTTVTITACANSTCTAPHFSGGVTVTLSPGGQSFIVGSTGVNSLATVHNTGTTSVLLSSSSTATNATTCVNSANNTTSCAFQGVDSGFLVGAPNQQAGVSTPVTIQAVRKSDNGAVCTSAFTTPRTVAFTCSYQDPATGTIAPTIEGQAIGTSCASGSAPVSVTFNSSGTGTVNLVYGDVGKVRLTATYTGTAANKDLGLTMTGFGDFIAVPYRMYVSQVRREAAASPSLTGSDLTTVGSPATTKFAAARERLLVQVTARTAAGANAPNFGKQSIPSTIGFQSVDGSAAYPSGGTVPKLDVVTPKEETFAAGVATTVVKVSEAGIPAFTAGLVGNFMNSDKVTLPSLTNFVSRIGAAAFKTEILPFGGVPMGCPLAPNAIAGCSTGTVYSKQPFKMRVTALNADGSTSTNFSGSYARPAVLSAWDGPGSSVTQNPPASPAGSLLVATSVTATQFVNGVADNLTQIYTFAGLASPTRIAVRATDAGDAATSAAGTGAAEGNVVVLSGRLVPNNNYGSELLPLPILLQAQYWNGSRWLVNVKDNSTTLFTNNFLLGTCTGRLKLGAGPACNTSLAALAASPAYVTLNNGAATMRLIAPGPGNTGSADLSLNPVDPAVLFLIPPAGVQKARAVFGVYRSPLIYQREVY